MKTERERIVNQKYDMRYRYETTQRVTKEINSMGIYKVNIVRSCSQINACAVVLRLSSLS